jgi:Ca-activated chloride channel family protein
MSVLSLLSDWLSRWFVRPQLLWGLLLVPIVITAFALDAARRRNLLARVGDEAMLREMVKTASPGRRLARAVLVTLGITLCVIGLAGPWYGGHSELLENRGIDVVIALDLSKSMLARDVSPSRLERAKSELDALLCQGGTTACPPDKTLVGDRVGMVAFAGTTASYPLTTDSEALRLFYKDLTPADMPVGGTAIGKAITAALDLLDDGSLSSDRTRVIILFTDGEDTVSDPLAAADRANSMGVRVYTVGIGTRSGEPVPMIDDNGQVVGYMHKPPGEQGYVTASLDEDTLQKISAKTGGDYYRLDPDRFGLDALGAALGTLKKADAESRLRTTHDEIYAWFLFPGFLLLLIEACLGDRRGQRSARLEARLQERSATSPPRRTEDTSRTIKTRHAA